MSEVFADPGTRRGMGWTGEDDTEEALAAIEGLWDRRFAEGWCVYDVRDDGRRVGMSGLGPIDDGEAWWAVYLLERGQGYGRAVGRRLVDRARRDGADRVVAVTWAANEASRRMLEALDFRVEGPAPYDWAHESSLEWLLYRHDPPKA